MYWCRYFITSGLQLFESAFSGVAHQLALYICMEICELVVCFVHFASFLFDGSVHSNSFSDLMDSSILFLFLAITSTTSSASCNFNSNGILCFRTQHEPQNTELQGVQKNSDWCPFSQILIHRLVRGGISGTFKVAIILLIQIKIQINFYFKNAE